jgi:hypothetical protein
VKKIFITTLFLLALYINGDAQNVSFGSGRHRISRKLLKNQRENAGPYLERIDALEALRDNLHNPKAFMEIKAALPEAGVDTNAMFTRSTLDLIKLDAEITKARIDYTAHVTTLTREGVRDSIAVLRDSLEQAIQHIRDTTQQRIMELSRTYKFSTDTFNKKVGVLLDNAQAATETLTETFKSTRIALRENNNSRSFFPAAYSREAIAFYTEKDTMASKFFCDNSLVYNSSIQKLAYASEAYCDFFGPIRLGLGYAITSASKSTDSAKNQSDAVQKIITNGGNLNYNVSFPLLALGDGSVFALKASLTTKGGVDIPKDSAAATTYGFLTSSGMNVNVFSRGYKNTIQLFFTSRLSYILGNKNFEKHLMENSFWLWQNSLGVAIKDKFRIRLDVYSGLSGENNQKFVRANFPVTLSFDIVNPF